MISVICLRDRAKTALQDEGMDERLDGVRVYRVTRMYVSSLPLLHSGNKMLCLCHYRRVGTYCVGRTWWPHFLLLPPTKGDVHVFARVCLSACLSVSKITQKRVHGFG